ncbi:hypothetical protein [Phaeobacter sp. J2-8]|uniref:hypothetical protein n=1 Tax=Phaeobacter sp. J2-8 TaxID=2931394 RepID=UPI001FD2CDD0|nr:hypothetical protein [Phaeobacter sp. J2-8]MCJ7874842.1 hypothetical protein [Phaeobacter sp. J2-8]
MRLLTRIWARLAARNAAPDLHLVIAGGIAPGAEALADSINRDPRIAGHVHIVAAEGAELEWLWARACMILCPSESADWNWPVTESRARGLPCLVADIPELADSDAEATVEALDPDDLPLWERRILAHAQTQQEARSPVVNDSPQTSWADMAAALGTLSTTPRHVTTLRALRAGEIALVGIDAPPWAIGFITGWHPAEAGLRHTASDRAVFRLRADRVLSDDGGPSKEDPATPGRLLLHLRLQLATDRPRARLRITCGDTCLFEAPVSGTSLPRDLVLAVPANALDPEGCLTLALHFPTRTGPAAPPSEDGTAPAPQGIGLVSAQLLDARRNNPLVTVRNADCWSEGLHAQEVDFALESHRAVVAPDLHVAPGWGVGSLLASFVLFVPILPGAGPRILGLTLRPVARPDAPSGASFYWNGRLLHEAQWHDNQPVALNLPLTEADLQTGPAVLEIRPTALATPADLGLGHEQGLSGLGLFDLTLTPDVTE